MRDRLVVAEHGSAVVDEATLSFPRKLLAGARVGFGPDRLETPVETAVPIPAAVQGEPE